MRIPVKDFANTIDKELDRYERENGQFSWLDGNLRDLVNRVKDDVVQLEAHLDFDINRFKEDVVEIGMLCMMIHDWLEYQ